jgi:hypothetical protein
MVGLRLWKPVDNLATLIAASSHFQTAVGETTADAALNHIYRGDTQDDGSQPRPRAVVGSAGGRSLKKTSTTNWSLTGPLFVLFEFATPAEFLSDPNGQYDWFAQAIEGIFDDLLRLSGQSNYLNVIEFVEEIPCVPCDPDLNGGEHYWFTEWAAHLLGG